MDSELILNSFEVDSKHLPKPPRSFAHITKNNTRQINPSIFNYPISFSVAIYPNLDRPASSTPLMWTRGLQHFRSFEKPYLGHIGFLDGHVETFAGKPEAHDPKLEQLFPSPDSRPSGAIRVLEFVPNQSNTSRAHALPTRLPEVIKEREAKWHRHNQIKGIISHLLPALLGGLLAGCLKKGTKAEKLSSAATVAFIIWLLTLLLIPSI